MASAEKAFHDCVDSLLKGFTVYDHTVDIVSCFQSFFGHSYKKHLTFFDRFPREPRTELTPDFTALFGDYGLIAEIKRTLPQDDLGFFKELQQLQKYDVPFSFRADEASARVTPKVQDIVLILSSPTSAYEIAKRITDLISAGKIKFTRNFVILEALYLSEEVASRYVFRKVHSFPGKFSSAHFPVELQLEKRLGDQAKSMEVYPKHFVKIKSKEVLCNDTPPPLYLAVVLWTKVLYDFLDAKARALWRQANPQKIIPIKVDASEIARQLNDAYSVTKGVRPTWVIDALEFLEASALARRLSKETWEIGYRNLNQLTGHRKFAREGEEDKHEIKEYGRILADYHCKEKSTSSRPVTVKGSKTLQTTLGNP